jgi:uncharacterized protein
MSRRLQELYPTAFVTGAGSGLGLAFTRMLLAEGVRVWGTSRDPARLGGLFPDGGFTAVALDLGNPSAAEEAFRTAAAAAGGGFDLVVNNAGYALFGEFTEVPWEAWEAQVQGVLVTTLRLAHAAAGQMRGRGRGCLVNVSSLAAEFPIPFLSGYNVAKAGLSALSESLVFELKGTGVRVVDFRPGDYRTAFNDAMKSHSSQASAGALTGRLATVWKALEAHLRAGPAPERAAADLRRSLLRHRSGIVRSGTLYQAVVAPFLSRFATQGIRRGVRDGYYGC